MISPDRFANRRALLTKFAFSTASIRHDENSSCRFIKTGRLVVSDVFHSALSLSELFQPNNGTPEDTRQL